MKVRNRRTGNILEFSWDQPTPPTDADIDRIEKEKFTDSVFGLPKEIDTLPPVEAVQEEEDNFAIRAIKDRILKPVESLLSPASIPKRAVDEAATYYSREAIGAPGLGGDTRTVGQIGSEALFPTEEENLPVVLPMGAAGTYTVGPTGRAIAKGAFKNILDLGTDPTMYPAAAAASGMELVNKVPALGRTVAGAFGGLGAVHALESGEQTAETVEREGWSPTAIGQGIDTGVGVAMAGMGAVGALHGTPRVEKKPLREELFEDVSDYYSGLERAINTPKMPKSATGEQWANILRQTPGVRKDEMDYRGVSDLLSSKPGEKISREDLFKHLDENRVEIEEIDLSESYNSHSRQRTRYGPKDYGGEKLIEDGPYDEYKEILVKRPRRTDTSIQRQRDEILNSPRLKELTTKSNDGTATAKELAEMEALERQDWELSKKQEKVESYKSPHFNEEGDNLLAHVRATGRRNSKGERVLNIEEYQSDLAHAYDDAGRVFKEDIESKQDKRVEELKRVSKELDSLQKEYEDTGNIFSEEKDARYKELLDQQAALNSELRYSDDVNHAPPSTPLIKGSKWVNLLTKRMIEYAAQNGYDRISWTTGEHQARRYGKLKDFSTAFSNYTSDGNIVVLVNKYGGTRDLSIDEANNLLGANFVNELISRQEDLRRGYVPNGELPLPKPIKESPSWMTNLYDKQIPNVFKEEAKRAGFRVEVEDTDIGNPFWPGVTLYHSINISQIKNTTPEFPLFHQIGSTRKIIVQGKEITSDELTTLYRQALDAPHPASIIDGKYVVTNPEGDFPNALIPDVVQQFAPVAHALDNVVQTIAAHLGLEGATFNGFAMSYRVRGLNLVNLENGTSRIMHNPLTIVGEQLYETIKESVTNPGVWQTFPHKVTRSLLKTTLHEMVHHDGYRHDTPEQVAIFKQKMTEMYNAVDPIFSEIRQTVRQSLEGGVLDNLIRMWDDVEPIYTQQRRISVNDGGGSPAPGGDRQGRTSSNERVGGRAGIGLDENIPDGSSKEAAGVGDGTGDLVEPTGSKELQNLTLEYNSRRKGLLEEYTRNPVPGAREELGKRLKALGMQYAANKRRLTGNLTAGEKYRLNKYVGKEVEVDGQSGKVISTSYGRSKVKLEDGSIVTIKNEDLAIRVEPEPEEISAQDVSVKVDPIVEALRQTVDPIEEMAKATPQATIQIGGKTLPATARTIQQASMTGERKATYEYYLNNRKAAEDKLIYLSGKPEDVDIIKAMSPEELATAASLWGMPGSSTAPVSGSGRGLPPVAPLAGGGGTGGGKPPIPPSKTPSGPTPNPSGTVGPTPQLPKDPTPFTQHVLSTANLMRAIQSSWDMSMPLRQSLVLTAGRPIKAARATSAGLKAMFSESFADKTINEIMTRPNAKRKINPQTGKEMPGSSLYEEAGLSLTGYKSGQNLPFEESFISQFSQAIPGIKQSNRAAVVFLDKMRSDVFDSIVDKWKKKGSLDPKKVSSLAEYINNATGRGKLPFGLERNVQLMNAILYSPKFQMSRMNLLNMHLNPLEYTGLKIPEVKLLNMRMGPFEYTKVPWEVRKEAIRDLAATVGAGTTLLGLAAMNGADVETDPRSSDFAKIKIGNTRIDIWGGYQQYVRFAAQQATGQYIPTTGKNKGTVRDYDKTGSPFKTSSGDAIETFARSRLSPAASMVWDYKKGSDVLGRKFDVKAPDFVTEGRLPDVSNLAEDLSMGRSIDERVLPLVWQDVYKMMEEDPSFAALAVPAFFGMGLQTYDSSRAK